MKKRIVRLILELILFVILLSTDIWLLSLLDNYILRFLLVFFLPSNFMGSWKTCFYGNFRFNLRYKLK